MWEFEHTNHAHVGIILRVAYNDCIEHDGHKWMSEFDSACCDWCKTSTILQPANSLQTCIIYATEFQLKMHTVFLENVILRPPYIDYTKFSLCILLVTVHMHIIIS